MKDTIADKVEESIKCSLCNKPLFSTDNDIAKEIIGDSVYYLHERQCLAMFKRLNHVYGGNVKSFLASDQYISDPFWDKTIPTQDEIKEINQELGRQYIKVIKDPKETLETAIELVEAAKYEILLLFSSANAFYRRINNANGYDFIKEVKSVNKNINIRILTPFSNKIDTLVDTLQKEFGIDIKYLSEPLQVKLTIMIVDRTFSLAAELKDDDVDNSRDAIGLSTYSNSKTTVLYYVSIFESLWKQADIYKKVDDLYTQIKNKNEEQRQLINIAAHELRNPIQPILSLADVMISNKNLNVHQQDELLHIIINNAKKLQLLANNILDTARIDGQLLKLDFEEFDLIELAKNAIDEVNQVKSKQIDIILKSEEELAVLTGDKLRLNQVFLNILNNAVKILDDGEKVTVYIEKEDNTNNILVRIVDSGPGISLNLKENLFSKFVTDSKMGTGLGLFICKNIIEGHGGRIWADNNKGKGATFSFTLPIKSP